MRLLMKGEHIEGQHYIPGSICKFPDGFKVRTYHGTWEDTVAPVDLALFRDGKDGRNGERGRDGRDSTMPGPPGKDSTVPGPRGKRGKAGEVIHTTRIVRRNVGEAEDMTHPVNFPCDVGQAITANGLASMLDPYVVGVVTEPGRYKTEGSITFAGIPGQTLYLDEFTSGLLTPIPPETGYICVVARQLTADKADLEVAPPIRL